MEIRRAQAGDSLAIYQLICELEEIAFDKGLFEQRYLKNIRNEEIEYLVACEEERIAGFISLIFLSPLHHEGQVAEVQELIVASGMRGKGIGKALLKNAVALARERGCEMIELSSNMQRLRAHAFYEKHGMRKTHVKLTMRICET